jgi:hypothetical protein
MQRVPVPEGRLKSSSVPEIFVVETGFLPLYKPKVFLLKGMLASNLSRDPFNCSTGTGDFPIDSRHFVPGYYHAVPLQEEEDAS